MIKKNFLSNNIIIYTINDKYFNNYIHDDLIIKFNNFGAMLDIKNKIYGMQHLLEHSIFRNYRNLNINTNASTTMNHMSVELNFSKEYISTQDPCIKFIKRCLFKNDDYTKIDLSRDLSEKDIKQYINELNSEYIYRSNLPIPWNLQSLIYSNNDVSYFGGNFNTFKNKIKDIQNYLKKPDSINPEDIVIILKKSKESYLEDIVKIFKEIKKLKTNKIKLKINPEKYYNKIIKINAYETNQLSFILYKKDLNYEYDILYIIEILYPFFIFEITELDEIFITFMFSDLYNLYNFYNILKFSLYNKLSLKNFYLPLNVELNYFMLDNYYPDKIIDTFFNNKSNLTFCEYYKKNENEIKCFFTHLSTLIKNKKFFLNTTKDFIYNDKTNISTEPFLIIDTNIIDNYFLNRSIENFNIVKYIQKKYFIYSHNLKCFNKFISIKNDQTWFKNKYDHRTFSLDIQNGKIIRYNNLYNNKLITYNIYINSLILFFSNPVFTTYKDCLDIISNNKKLELFLKEYYQDIDLKFSKKNFIINTGYDFIFCVVKINKKHNNKIKNLNTNIEEYLKELGITYYLESVLYILNKFSLVFFFTQSNKKNFLEIYNVIKNILYINHIKNDIVYVISEKSNEINLSSLNKFVKFSI